MLTYIRNIKKKRCKSSFAKVITTLVLAWLISPNHSFVFSDVFSDSYPGVAAHKENWVISLSEKFLQTVKAETPSQATNHQDHSEVPSNKGVQKSPKKTSESSSDHVADHSAQKVVATHDKTSTKETGPNEISTKGTGSGITGRGVTGSGVTDSEGNGTEERSARRKEDPSSMGKKSSALPSGMVQIPYGIEYKPLGPDPRGPVNLTICSQNLMNYKATEKSSVRLETLPADLQRKIEGLLRRFEAAQCDVIAVQEVLGNKEEEARNSLRHLATILSIRTGRQFDFIVSPGDHEPSRVGYMVAKDSAEVLNSMAFSKVELPKLSPNEKTRFFVRTPLELQLRTKDPEGRGAKVITLINLHSKAKRGAQNDPTESKWETYRMEIAEAVRRIVLNRHRGSLFSGKSIIAILGDRNANFNSASAKILDGSLTLKHFAQGGKCSVSKDGMPYCKPGIDAQPSFYSVLTTDPDTKLIPGTHVFKGEASWLDDILLSIPSLRFAWASFERAGDYESGVISAFPAASDHALVWTKLNW